MAAVVVLLGGNVALYCAAPLDAAWLSGVSPRLVVLSYPPLAATLGLLLVALN